MTTALVLLAIQGALGAFLAHLLPEVSTWARRPTGFVPADHGPLAWLLTFMAVGVFLSGLRDLVSARRPAKRAPSHA